YGSGGGQDFSYGSTGGGGAGGESSGAGWMNSGGGGGGDEDNKTRGGYKNQTVRPVTIKQLVDVPASTGDSPISIDGEEVKNVTFVGVIRNVVQQPINVIYSIEDGTGKIDVRVWTGGSSDGGDAGGDEGQGGSNQTADPAITVGKYVRVHGELRFFNGKRNVSSHRVRLITDHNEITYHGMEAIYVHLTKTRGPPPALRQSGAPAAAAGSGYGANMGAASAYSGSAAGGAYGGMSTGGSSFTPIQQAVLDVIKNAHDPNGLHVNTIRDNLVKQRFQPADISHSIEWLNTEGHLYYTIDEMHVQCTSM
ncbi:Replication factor A protein 2, partial [Coemansia sp. RSA 2320]